MWNGGVIMRIYIRAGNTMWSLSEWFQMPVKYIIDSNPEVDPRQMMNGQEIHIPGYVDQPYSISPGDTLWHIARERGIAHEALIISNPNVNPNRLQIGQTIRLPVRVTWPIVQGKRDYDYAAMMAEIDALLKVYPFIRQQSIGQSVMGKSLPELRIGRGEKSVHMNASFHAHEWITTPIIMSFLNHYLLTLTNQGAIRGLVMDPFYDLTDLSIVPMVNPDGVNLVIHGAPEQEPFRTMALSLNAGSTNFDGWKANIRGVDLNNQYPALWTEETAVKPDQPGPRDYPGQAPLTEPESIAMAELTQRSDFSRVLALHTQGKVIFWGFQGLEPLESETIVQEFARVSGYDPIQYVDSFAGYKDWFIQEWRRPGFTVELGSGVNPLPIEQFDDIYAESLGIYLAALYM